MDAEKTKELQKELKQILKVYEIEENSCWFDGKKCPYGAPNGKFIEAPLRWCVKCQTVENNNEVLEEIFIGTEIPKEDTEEDIKEKNTEEIKKELEDYSENLKELLFEFAKGDETTVSLINLLDKYLEFGGVEVIRKEKIKDL